MTFADIAPYVAPFFSVVSWDSMRFRYGGLAQSKPMASQMTLVRSCMLYLFITPIARSDTGILLGFPMVPEVLA